VSLVTHNDCPRSKVGRLSKWEGVSRLPRQPAFACSVTLGLAAANHEAQHRHAPRPRSEVTHALGRLCKLRSGRRNTRFHPLRRSTDRAKPPPNTPENSKKLTHSHEQAVCRDALARHCSSGVELRHLNGERIVLRASCELRNGRLREAGVALRVAARAARDELALSLVASGIGIAIAPRSLATDRVVAVPLNDFGVRRSIGLAWHPEIPGHLLAAMLDAVGGQARAAGMLP
jgi:hypothetical protein